MDLSYSAEQRLLQSSVQKFARDYLARDRVRSLASPDGSDRDTWHAIAQLGWLAAAVPEHLGGYGGSVIETLLIHEGVGLGLIIEPLLSVGLVVKLLALAASPSAEGLLQSLLSGEARWALAHEEPAGRGDPAVVEACARPVTDGWELSGCKCMVLGAPSADGLIVSARIRPAQNVAGDIALFCLDRPKFAERLKCCRTLDGQHAADLELQSVKVARDARLGVEGCAASVIAEAYDHATLASCAEAVGAMDAALSLTAEHLKNRKQFGAPLASFQALQHKLADMVIAVEQARSILLFGAAGVMKQGDPVGRARAVSAAKVRVMESARVVGAHSIQLHGGMGVTEEHLISHYFRRMLAVCHRFGAADYHLARFMGSGG
jgi:alkylation response protein AidB-like acyl-CoA dehydrogenase